ncbi:MAG: hypothetical protein RIM99_18660 [Cyclobacteriaceae bacterium]
MEKKEESYCFRCGETEQGSLENLYGYTVCKACQGDLKLYQDITIKMHISAFKKARLINPKKLSYKEEVDYRLVEMEKDYIRKRIRLLHIQDRLKKLS